MPKRWRSTTRKLVNRRLFRAKINPLALHEVTLAALHEVAHDTRNDHGSEPTLAVIDAFILGYKERGRINAEK